jgi:hypothetical protein
MGAGKVTAKSRQLDQIGRKQPVGWFADYLEYDGLKGKEE